MAGDTVTGGAAHDREFVADAFSTPTLLVAPPSYVSSATPTAVPSPFNPRSPPERPVALGPLVGSESAKVIPSAEGDGPLRSAVKWASRRAVGTGSEYHAEFARKPAAGVSTMVPALTVGASLGGGAGSTERSP